MSDGAIISLITVNYNGGDFLPDFFDSLFKVSRDRFEVEIIVVDNGSTDGIPRVDRSKVCDRPGDPKRKEQLRRGSQPGDSQRSRGLYRFGQ